MRFGVFFPLSRLRIRYVLAHFSLWCSFQQMYTRDGPTQIQRDKHTHIVIHTTIYATVMFTSHAKIADIFCDVKSNDISNNDEYAHTHSRYLKMMLRWVVAVVFFLLGCKQPNPYLCKCTFQQRLHFRVVNGVLANFHITRMAVGYSNVLWLWCVFMFILLLLKLFRLRSYMRLFFTFFFLLNGRENRKLLLNASQRECIRSLSSTGKNKISGKLANA